MVSQSAYPLRLLSQQTNWKILYTLISGLAASYGVTGGTAIAQITPDGSTPTTFIPPGGTSCPGICINGGSRGAGSNNVFHSFSNFNVGNGATVTFHNDPGVTNIFSRITTINPLNTSNIDGTLGVNGPANLFLLNPNGIVFGNSAVLNVQGSFLATTADSILFEDGSQFSAVSSAADASSLLTVSAPIGLQFGSSPRPISVQGNGSNMRYSSRGIVRNFRGTPLGLRVPTGENLALLGGNINLQGGNLIAEEGHVEVGSIGSNGYVSFKDNNPRWQFGYEQVPTFQDITLSQGNLISQASAIDVSGADAGSIQLQGRQINLNSGSTLLAQVSGSGNGNIAINATDGLTLTGVNLSGATGVFMQTSAYVEIAPSGTGGGNSSLSVNAPKIDLSGGAQIGLTMAGAGQAGTVQVQSQEISSDGISNVGPSSIFTTVAPLINTPANALGGNLNITATQQLNITNGSQIAANTFGPGNGGNLAVTADTVNVTGFGTQANGALVPSLLQTSSQTAPNDSLGPPGGPPLLIPSGQGSGNSGSATVNARRVVVADGGQIVTGTNSNNAAGNLTINASESVELRGQTANGRSGVLSGAREGSGTGGNITVNTPQLSILDGATINTSNFPSSSSSNRTPGTGPAGNITLNTRSIAIKDGSVITADTVAGDRANIGIQTEDIVLRNNSRITTDATGSATGGDITIDATALIALENSDITANADDNFGGRIIVNAQTILGTAYREQETPESDITATSALGPAFSGSVDLNTPDIDPTDGLIVLSENLVGTEQIAAACEQLDNNTFVTTGRGGLPEGNSHLIIGDSIWNDFRFLENTNSSQSKDNAELLTDTKPELSEVSPSYLPSPFYSPRIVEAQTWFVNDNGQIVLGAYPDAQLALQPVDCLSDLSLT